MQRPPLWLPPDLCLLDDRSPLPLDRPFTTAEAGALGVSRELLRKLRDRALVREVVRGVQVVAQVPDTIECRVEAVRLVLPAGAVVTDRTAAWLHGVDVLPRRAAYEPVPLDVFSTEESRLRRPGVRSGIRMLGAGDLCEVEGVPVTTPLRTALDLGRLLRRHDAIGALDAFLRIGVSPQQLLAGPDRFGGYRGVVQLRELAPLADARAESPPESALRLYAHDEGLPAFEPQYWVHDDAGVPVFRLDLAVPALHYAAEYHGERFHAPNDRQQHDEARMEWLARRSWEVEAFWKGDVYAPGADPGARLRRGVLRARSRLGDWVPEGAFLP